MIMRAVATSVPPKCNKPKHHTHVSAPQENEANTNNSSERSNTSQAVATADQTHLNEFQTDITMTNTSQPKHRAAHPTDTENKADKNLTTYDMAPCFRSLDLRQTAIEGDSGRISFRSLNASHSHKCEMSLQVPIGNIVRLQIKTCTSVKVEIIDCVNGTRKRDTRFSVACPAEKSFSPMYSQTDTVVVKAFVYFPGMGKTSLGKSQLAMGFHAVNESERPDLELVYRSALSGYVQTPGWDGVTAYPPFIKNCVTLTQRTDHVIFLSFLSLDIGDRDKLVSFPGHCGSKENQAMRYWSGNIPEAFLFPDDVFIGEQTHDVPFSFSFSSGDRSGKTGFRVRFSYHPGDLKPERMPDVEEKEPKGWNCSVSVWPGLHEHFPCDLVPQCAGSEDEAPCPYTSEKCGPDRVETGGRCYIYTQQKGRSWFDSQEECQHHGAHLVSLETPQEWEEVGSLLGKAYTHYTWTGLKSTRTSARDVPANALYTNTWQWESGFTVFYMELKKSPRHENLCGLLTDQRSASSSSSSSSRALAISCMTRFFASFLCELPAPEDPSHLQPVRLPTPPKNTTTTTSLSPPGVSRLVTCPSLLHVTHEMLACDADSRCGKLVKGEEERWWFSRNCEASPTAGSQPYFYCGGGGGGGGGGNGLEEFVPYSVVCDFREDCAGGGDEEFCFHLGCGDDTFHCGHGQCVAAEKQCDGHTDCTTNLDEAHCPDTSAIPYDVTPPAVVNFDRPGGFTVTPLPREESQCPDSHFRCPEDGYCLPVYARCNQVNDCPGQEDEAECERYTCPGFYRCRGRDRTVCLHVRHLCDGWPQCPQHDDELLCDMTCPQPCTCQGLALTCSHTFAVASFPHLRYLQARDSGLLQSDVVRNLMLIHLGVEACGWSNLTDFALPNLHSLDLSHNALHAVNFSHFLGIPHLRRLSLADNPITITLTRSRRHVETLPEGSGGQDRQRFKSLNVLDLRGCPLSDFTPDFMKGMTDLRVVYADNFKLCCSAVLPDFFRGECSAPADEISSCDDLLKSSVYRAALALFAVLAIVGNLGSFVYRLCFSSERVRNGFMVFVLNLCVSDFLMGVYLALIGAADRVYAGSYVWSEAAWKMSTLCSVAGFVSLVSSEVSALVICVITLDRFLVLHFPWSQLRFGVSSAHGACLLIWTLGLALAAVPLLPATSRWAFYRQTGICIPLPVTRADFAGHGYSFGVMIVFNLVLFLLIAVGQSFIYWSVRSNAMGPGHRTETTKSRGGESGAVSKEAAVATRLLSVAVTDFLCWFPIGLCGLLASVGVLVPGEVNVAMAIFVLPLNSALNPFLYTLNVVLEKRRKAQELRFQKFLQAQLKK